MLYFYLQLLYTYLLIMIKILQANINRCKAAQDLLLHTEKNLGFGISIISEPYQVPEDNMWTANNNVTAAIHYNMQSLQYPGTIINKGQYSVTILWQGIAIIACYISPNCDDLEFEEFLDELDETVASCADYNILLGGDFNAKSTLWGNPRTNSRGDRLSRWSAMRDLTLINSGKNPTCIRPQGTSIIDLTWCSESLRSKISEWCVRDEETLSDHLYISYKISLNDYDNNMHRIKKKKYVRWAYKKFDTDKFKEALNWEAVGCLSALEEENNTNSAEWLQDIIHKACDFAMPRAKLSYKKAAYWWSSTITEIRKSSQKARRKWQKSKAKRDKDLNLILELEEAYRDLKKQLVKAIRNAKVQAWQELIDSIERDPWGLPYRIVLKKLKRSTPSATETMDINTVNQVVDKLFPVDPEWDSGEDPEINNYLWNDEDDIGKEEVCRAIRKGPGANTAPGIDGIKAIFLKNLPDEFLTKLANIYTMYIRKGIFPKIWKRALLILIPKGENLQSKKYRPICLLNELGKVFERIINERIMNWMEEHPASNLAENQFGFRRGKSTCDALMTVKKYIEESKRNREIAIGVSLDVTNAFNSIQWRHIKLALRDKKFPVYIRRIIHSYLSDRFIEFPTAEGTTQERAMTAGVPQGSVLGPTLWNIAYDAVLRTQKERGCVIAGYADDTLIMSRGSTILEARARTNLQISLVLRNIDKIGLKIELNKTGAILFNSDMLKTRHRARDDDDDNENDIYNERNIGQNIFTIDIRREAIHLNDKLKYLGLILDDRWKFREHFQYIEKKTSKITRALHGIMPNLKGPRESKRRLYAHVINSIINYGAPIWSEAAYDRKNSDILRRIQRAISIRVIAAYRTVSADAALLMARIVPTPIQAAYLNRVFQRSSDLKMYGTWSPAEEKQIKKDEAVLLHRQLYIYLQRRDVAGVRTVKAILPNYEKWWERTHGEMSFHLTQLLSGHGCFATYLYRIGKENSNLCRFCESAEDTTEHTIQVCVEWREEREELLSILGGNDLSLEVIIAKMLESEDNWQAVSSFAEKVMLLKEEEERERERLPDNNNE